MVVVMMVMPVRSERGTGSYKQQQGSKDPLLHGTNLACAPVDLGRFWWVRTTKPTCFLRVGRMPKKRKLKEQ
jgi:hypothetical protein